MKCSRKSASSAYFSHNGGRVTMNQRGQIIFFGSLELIYIIIELNLLYKKSAYESAVSY